MSFNSVQIRIVATYLESLTTSITKDANPCDSELVLLSFVTRRKSKLRYRLVSSSNVVSALFGRSSSEVENPVRPSSSKSDARIWRSPQTISLSLHTLSSSSAYRQTHSQTRLNELCVSSCSLKISVVRLDVSFFFNSSRDTDDVLLTSMVSWTSVIRRQFDFRICVRRFYLVKSNRSPWRIRWQTSARLSSDTRRQSYSPTRVLDASTSPSSYREENERQGDKRNRIFRGSWDPKCISDWDSDWSKMSSNGQGFITRGPWSTDDSGHIHYFIPSKLDIDASIDNTKKLDMTSFNAS